MKLTMMFFTVLLSFTWLAQAERATHVIIRSIPPGDSNGELGIIYSNTGFLPAKLEIYCKEFVSEDGWNGVVPSEEHLCGTLELQYRLTSLGISMYYLDYAKNNPMIIHLWVDPEATTIRAILGTYKGAKAGIGVAAAGRAMVLRNDLSGIWAATGQVMVPGEGSKNLQDHGFGGGLDISIPWLEIYLKTPTDLNQRISEFKIPTS